MSVIITGNGLMFKIAFVLGVQVSFAQVVASFRTF
jgi:hypothetical protein